MATSVNMVFGAYIFDPVPSFSYTRSAERTPGENTCLSTKMTITLEGLFVPTVPGFTNISAAIALLSDYFVCGNCQQFSVECDGNFLFKGPATVINLSVQPRSDGDLYVQTAAYTIELEMQDRFGDIYDNQPLGITSISDTWSWQWRDERVGGTVDTFGIFNEGPTTSAEDDTPPAGGGEENGMLGPAEDHTIFIASAWDISHTMTVTSPYICKYAGDVKGWVNAANAILSNEPASLDGARDGIANLFRIPLETIDDNQKALTTKLYNHFRTLNVDKHAGSVSMNETWIASNQKALEDFTVTLEQDNIDINKSITVNGTIQGLIDDMTYSEAPFGTTNGTPKLQSALEYWTFVKGQLVNRARTIYDESLDRYTSGLKTVNSIPTSRSVGYNTVAGTVTYNYVFSDRAKNCIEDAALFEDISITENEPPDIFSSLTILGRAGGPLLQDIGTVGQRTRTISVQSILPTSTGCGVTGGGGGEGTSSGLLWSAPTGYDSLITEYEQYLRDTYDQVFITQNQKQWDLKTGKLNWTKSFTVGDCE